DMFYDGHPKAEPGAIVCRVSPSFVRFGHFELLAARGDMALLESLLQFVVKTDRPDLAAQLTGSTEAGRSAIYLQWFAQVCQLTQDMIVHWMRVGFVHGVMNTDNMSVLGLTIDYGPYGWIDDYNPDWTPNTTDSEQRRYRFGQQAAIARWNLFRLANALYPVIKDADALQSIVDGLPASYESARYKMMAGKLGLADDVITQPQFKDLLDNLETLLCCQPIDMTIFFRCLIEFACQGKREDGTFVALADVVRPALYPLDGSGVSQIQDKNLPLFQQWEKLYRQFLAVSAFNHENRQKCMAAANPVFVLRNYLAQQAIDGLEQGDRTEFDALLRLLRQPYAPVSGPDQRFAERRPAWASNRAGCTMLSCSS
ncbi:MAG: protein adenylyltransferase SelO family protein, partial [Pseudohongiella sp.]